MTTPPLHPIAQLKNDEYDRTARQSAMRSAGKGALGGAALGAMGAYATGKKLHPALAAGLAAAGGVAGAYQGRDAGEAKNRHDMGAIAIDDMKFQRQQRAMSERAEARKKTASLSTPALSSFSDELTKSAGVLGALTTLGQKTVGLGMRAANAVGRGGAAAGAYGGALRAVGGNADKLHRGIGGAVIGGGALLGAAGVGTAMAGRK
jgi:hypothetical protein